MIRLSSFAAIVLAAGRGTRMRTTTTNKVLLDILDKPMIIYTIELLEQLHISPIIVVIGYHRKKVESTLKQRVKYIEQTHQLGTGHAVGKALSSIPTSKPNVI